MEKKVAKKPTKKVEAKKVDEKSKKVTTQVEPKAKKVSKREVVTAPVEQAVVNEPAKVNEPVETKAEQKTRKITLNQELNLMIGLFSIITIISLCLAFQGGDSEVLGWELFLNAGQYSGVFKGLMIIYVVSIFIDCILAVRLDTENEVVNIVEKALYMFTLVINIVVNAVLLSLIKNIGIGLIIFMIISIVSAIVKLARIYAQNK